MSFSVARRRNFRAWKSRVEECDSNKETFFAEGRPQTGVDTKRETRLIRQRGGGNGRETTSKQSMYETAENYESGETHYSSSMFVLEVIMYKVEICSRPVLCAAFVTEEFIEVLLEFASFCDRGISVSSRCTASDNSAFCSYILYYPIDLLKFGSSFSASSSLIEKKNGRTFLNCESDVSVVFRAYTSILQPSRVVPRECVYIEEDARQRCKGLCFPIADHESIGKNGSQSRNTG